ncbi:MAG: hypothetical protein K2Y28_06820 [Burkholderiaceae bacterium]|nr:hypothetical protein [Burkholderiaceae bacterium]
MNVTRNFISFALGICFTLYFLWLLNLARIEAKSALRLNDLIIETGYKKTLKRIPIFEIQLIELAGLFDVAPFDYCWVITSNTGMSISFLGRENGAKSVLEALEQHLPNFTISTSIARNNEKSMFEELVDVWRKI